MCVCVCVNDDRSLRIPRPLSVSTNHKAASAMWFNEPSCVRRWGLHFSCIKGGAKQNQISCTPASHYSTLSFWKFPDLFFPHYVLLPKVRIRTEQPSGTSGELYSVKHSCSSRDAINNALKCQSVCSRQRFVGSRQELHYSRACTPLQLRSRDWDITQLLELSLC